MDYSSLAEAQQQQSDQQQAYDPAQAQAYAAYYAACDQYYAASGYYQQPYYSHDYSASSNVASAGVYYTEAQADSTAPPADGAQIHHSSAHGTAYAPATEQDGYSYQATSVLNPAAVDALSQLSQLTGSIDAAERMMAAGMHNRPQSSNYQQYSHPMTTQHGVPSIRPGGGLTHRGGGRRGGGPLRGRGGNRGRMGQRPYGGGAPLSHGGGHGRASRGRGRRPFGTDLQQRQTAPPKSLLPVAWCDICRVDCNSLEILEQHKNGKRHKRTVQRVQEIQSQQQVNSTDWQYSTVPKPDLFIQGEDGGGGTDPSYAMNIAVAASASSAQELAAAEPIGGFVPPESYQQAMEVGNQAQMAEGQSEPVSDIANAVSQGQTQPADGVGKRRRTAGYDRNDRWRGSRQKVMRIGSGGRRFWSSDRTHNRPFERPKDRPRDRPRVCTVCNVMCDTMAVFECHLTGKKHISRIKRYDGHGSVYGPISVYIPPNQVSTYPNKAPEAMFYGLQSLEALQQQAHDDDSQQVETLPVEQCYQVESFEEAAGEATESKVKQSLGRSEDGGPASDAIDGERVVAMPELDKRSSLSGPNALETDTSAPDDGALLDGIAGPIVGHAASLEHGASIESEVVEPELNADSEALTARE